MLRIFLTSSHLSAVLQSIYAGATKKAGNMDVLITDYPPQKRALTDLIMSTRVIHPWDYEFNYATELTNDTNLKPGLRKRITRKLSGMPVFSMLYRKMHQKHMDKLHAVYEERLRSDFKEIMQETIELNLLTKTGLNEVLFRIFPKAKVNYFEHGMGDYMYFAANRIPPGNFYCLFHKEFADYAQEKQLPLDNRIKGYLEYSDFTAAVKKLVEHDIVHAETVLPVSQQRLVFMMLENVEMYQVPSNFWTDYIDLCLSRLSSPKDYVYIIKPHPSQSFEAIETSKKHLEKLGLSCTFYDSRINMNISAEILFYQFYQRTDHVFCMLSSSVYYMSKLYPLNDRQRINYYFGYRLFGKYIQNAPKKFKEIYKELGPIITNVLSKDCIEF